MICDIFKQVNFLCIKAQVIAKLSKSLKNVEKALALIHLTKTCQISTDVLQEETYNVKIRSNIL